MYIVHVHTRNNVGWASSLSKNIKLVARVVCRIRSHSYYRMNVYSWLDFTCRLTSEGEDQRMKRAFFLMGNPNPRLGSLGNGQGSPRKSSRGLTGAGRGHNSLG
ncbi:hypothetical protein BDFG_01203 [Blastomyces dermatitidis ATCC 26199]|nr:hypothetical protein BDFG_01203 [Blastomyces dermatitidis ATCC 26199]